MSNNNFLIKSNPSSAAQPIGAFLLALLITVLVLELKVPLSIEIWLLFAFFWSVFLLILSIYLKTRDEYVEINDQEIAIHQHKTILHIAWSQIQNIGFQAITARRMGILEIHPHLAISLPNRSIVNDLKSSQEPGFIQKKQDLGKYMNSNDTHDLYINMQYAQNSNQDLLGLLSSKIGFSKSLPPLIKTADTHEYERILKEIHV